MYIPPAYNNSSLEDAFTFIQSFPLGMLVTQGEKRPIASHLPFIVEKNENQLVLFSHLAKANPQLNKNNDEEVLLIFSSPNAYISPSAYEKKTTLFQHGIILQPTSMVMQSFSKKKKKRS